MDAKFLLFSLSRSFALCVCATDAFFRRAAKSIESIWTDSSAQLNDLAILLSPAPLALLPFKRVLSIRAMVVAIFLTFVVRFICLSV